MEASMTIADGVEARPRCPTRIQAMVAHLLHQPRNAAVNGQQCDELSPVPGHSHDRLKPAYYPRDVRLPTPTPVALHNKIQVKHLRTCACRWLVPGIVLERRRPRELGSNLARTKLPECIRLRVALQVRWVVYNEHGASEGGGGGDVVEQRILQRVGADPPSALRV